MNTNTVDPQAPTTEPTDSRPEPRYGFDLGRTALRRPLEDRMLAGGASGPARFFGVDTTIVRIALVGLAPAGGAGGPPLPAGLLRDPSQGGGPLIGASFIEGLQQRHR